MEADGKPVSTRPRGRESAGWIILAFAAIMAFSAASNATSDGLRTFLIVDGILLSLGLVVLVVLWLLRGRRSK